MMKKGLRILKEVISVAITILIFGTPFYFMFINSVKDQRSANQLSISWPETFHWENYKDVLAFRDYTLLRAFKNSLLLTVLSVFVLIIVGAMAGYVLQRRNDRPAKITQSFIMIGLMLPAAIMPTINLLQKLNIYKTLFSMVMIEIALNIPFTIMLYRTHVATVPREIDDAASIDGCSPVGLFLRIILPLLKSGTATVIILNSVTIFNDFTNPLYFLPGSENVTVQLTLYNFMGQFQSSYHLLFADVILITIPMLIIFLLFNNRIVSGLTSGAIKG